MPNSLQGKTVILTGSHAVASVKQLIVTHGGIVKHFPLIETVEYSSDEDVHFIETLPTYDWLIFTSQNAVAFFLSKCRRAELPLANLKAKIVAVGEKTKQQLLKANVPVHFMPSVYSADVLIKEFQLSPGERGLFIRGSMAKSTIADGLAVDEWTVYETKKCLHYIGKLDECIVMSEEPIVIFASPSAVEVYAEEIAPLLDWQYVKIASIGHVTTEALARYGVKPFVQPKTYTMQAVIEQLILEETTR